MIVYLLKVSLAMILFWLLYWLVFKRLTFFTSNRFFLIGSVLLSFTLPLIRFVDKPLVQVMTDYTFSFDWEQIASGSDSQLPSLVNSSIGIPLTVLGWVYVMVVSVLAIRGFAGFLRVRKKFGHGLRQRKDGFTLVSNNEIRVPFTVLRTIYLDPYTFEKGIVPVIRHEMVHARQLHSIDLIIMEFACAFLWFNPFVFLFRRYIRDNHEYLADQYANNDRTDLVHYMQTLSETLSRSVYPVNANYFTSSTIKKRIMMLTKNKTRSRRKWLYLFIIPIIGLLVMSFQQPMGNTIKSSFAMDNEMLDLSSTEIIQSGEDVPSRFPLEDIYRKGITFTYGREGKHPITGKIMIHKGIDFRAPKGSPVYATANGIVATSEFHEKYGKLIVIKHNDTYATLYAHLDNLMVAEGNKVAPGQMIGTVGNTGLSTGDHLHYEVRKDGQNVDPAEYYQE